MRREGDGNDRRPAGLERANTEPTLSGLPFADDGAPPPNMELAPCSQCGRKFNSASLARHEKVCKSVFMSKRKAFAARGNLQLNTSQPTGNGKGGRDSGSQSAPSNGNGGASAKPSSARRVAARETKGMTRNHSAPMPASRPGRGDSVAAKRQEGATRARGSGGGGGSGSGGGGGGPQQGGRRAASARTRPGGSGSGGQYGAGNGAGGSGSGSVGGGGGRRGQPAKRPAWDDTPVGGSANGGLPPEAWAQAPTADQDRPPPTRGERPTRRGGRGGGGGPPSARAAPRTGGERGGPPAVENPDDRPIGGAGSSQTWDEKPVSRGNAWEDRPIAKAPGMPADVPVVASVGTLVPCGRCGRSFAADRIQKHETACAKVKQRKPMDITKMRLKDTGAAEFFDPRKKNAKDPPKKKGNWRRDHEEFIATIRNAKNFDAHEKKGGKASDFRAPPPSDKSDYSQCPHCSRKFSQMAAQRHIPICANNTHKPKPPPTSNRFADRNTMRFTPMNKRGAASRIPRDK